MCGPDNKASFFFNNQGDPSDLKASGVEDESALAEGVPQALGV